MTPSDNQSLAEGEGASPVGHTKGPWTADKLGEIKPDSERVIRAELGLNANGIRMVRTVAFTASHAGADEALANARLIAAAPELLEAVITLRLILRLAALKFDFSLDDSEGMAQADAAIDKARGGHQ